MKKIERSILSGGITETKQVDVNGVAVGIVSGYIATWANDAYTGIYGVPDQIVQGAYSDSIAEHKRRNDRQVRLKDHHFNTIGGFPINTVREDGIGLFGEGHINLETQQGREAYSLARQGVLVDFSVGHIVEEEKVENNVRKIFKAKLIEGSIVDEPKNQKANILEVKSFADLPIATSEVEWDAEAARERVMDLKYADGNGADAFIGDHIIADVIDGKLRVVPEAIHALAEEVKQSGDKELQHTLERYFAKMDVESPFESKTFYTVEDVKDWTNVNIKAALVSTGRFSNGAARALVARMGLEKPKDSEMKALVEKLSLARLAITNK